MLRARAPLTSLLLWTLLAAGAWLLASPRAFAQLGGNDLIGDAGAVLSTPIGAEINPANAGFVDRTSSEIFGPLYQSSTLLARYPGFDAAQKSESGLKAPIGGAGAIFKLTSKIGIGGFYVPGIGLGLDVKFKRLPIVILDQVNYIDVAGHGTLNGAGHVVLAFRPFRAFGIGINFTTADVSAKVGGSASDSGVTLFTADARVTITMANLGVRLDLVPGRLALGAAVSLVKSQNAKIAVGSPLIDTSALGAGAGINQNTSAQPFSSILVGGMIAPIPKFRVVADVKYDRADKNEQLFSMVDLKQKKRDAHDTLSFRGGGIFNINESTNGMVGYHKEPAKYGEGGRGEGSLSGFGTIDLIMVMAGAGDLVPYEQYAGGVQFGLMPKIERHGKEVTGYYALSVATGLVYKKASLGIDEKGELPGAYYYKATTIPVGLTYRM